MPVESDTVAPLENQGGTSTTAGDTNNIQEIVDPVELDGPIANGTHAKGPVETQEAGPSQTTKEIKKTDGSASFLRAARAGNLEKVLEFLKTNTDINTCNSNGLNALHLASKEGHVHIVQELLARQANVDAATKKGNTALHIASLAGQDEIVKVLVQSSAQVNTQSQNGFTPLYMAAQENHDNVVRFLLAHGANQSLATEDGFTPLAVALQQGHDKVVAVLLENDTRGKIRLPALHIAAKKDDTKAAALLLQTDNNPDVTSKSGFTPLHIAAHYGNENIASLLIQRGADCNYVAKHQITPLHVASKWGRGNMVSLLIDKGANIESKTRDGLTPLHCAARSGHEAVVDMLLEKGAPITAKTKNGLAPLHMASQGDHVDAARILLYHKAPVDDVTVDYLTALHVAAHCGHVRVAKLLLDRKADPNSRALNGFTPLHIACKKNRIKVVELLLKHGGSIEATTESGLTPLHVASFMGCMNIVIYLLQHGASADIPTVRGETPLHLAARANQTDIIRILLRNGAQVDARAREQQTALHIASRLGNSDIVVLLLQHGAAVDATTKDHYTALHIAAKEGQEEVASVLLEQGASLTATTKKGFTPLHLAAKYGSMKVARLLLQKDAPVDAQGKNGVTPLHVAAHYDHQNVALLLLDKGASPHATAKNGYTPLHIAARKNQMDIATTLLEYGASANAESKAGFTPLHLSSQEGHTDMSTLLIEHGSSPASAAKNGLTPLHLCAQEDRVNVGAILVKHGSNIDPSTKAGYTPLHVACHFGQTNMVRFLLQHGSQVDAATQLGYTPLHQAAQQGHTQIVNLLLESKAEPNSETKDGKTALSIAQRLGYISVVETLKIVTETTITTSTTTVTEEKYKVVVPETMHETFMSESEDEGGDDTMLSHNPYQYLTVDEMKSLGDDSMNIDVTRDEKMDVSFRSNQGDRISPQHLKEHYLNLQTDNVDVTRQPILAGFLVSFMVDARGGAMRGCRHSGVRVIIPPRKAAMPMRITCRYLKKDKLVHAPPLMEGEALASRILEMGPAAAKFLGPVIIEVPHFASLRGKEREIVILRSDNGETWREHTLEATEEAVQEVLNESFDGEELKQLEDLNTSRITRILTTDFPQYFAIVTRIRQEVHAIGPEGGMVSSTVVPQVQAVFPEGALTKKIKVGLQAQPIAPDLVAKLLGNRVAVSPIVTVEPRRRKFHKPITLTIPVPQAANKGMINQYSGEAPTLRLLCSITGGTTRAQWEDVTGSTPLTFVNDCVSFTTTVSARFWLMDCNNISEATKMATELYREAIHVPFMAKFVVFSKRHQLEEARLRVFCMTDDKEDKTLETQENFVEVAKSRDVEVLEGKSQHLEFAGNLVPITKSGDQLAFNFYAFRENRLPFNVRVKDQHADSVGRVAFMRQPKVGRGDPPQTPICNLNITLPENILPEPAPSEPDLLALGKKYSFLSISKTDTIHKADLRLSDISNMLSQDWVGLARELEISDSDINIIKSQYPDNAPQQAIVMLRLWMQTSGNKATGNTLEKGLRKIGRDDIVNQCIFNVELVTDDMEKAVAKEHLDHSGFDLLKTGLGPSKGTPLRRDMSMDVSYDEQDIMKQLQELREGESGEEDDSLNQKPYQDKPGRIQPTAADLSPTYEREEKKYAGEEKDVPEEKEKSQRIEEVKKEEDSQVKVIKNEVEEIKKTESNKEVTEKTESKTEISTTIKDGEKTTTKVTTKKTEDGVEKTTLITTSKVEEAEGTAVSDVMVSEKKTSNVVQETTEADKKQLLMKLGEELGKLDEQLEAKFKEKSKPEDPQEGFTQTSVEQSQTILPADVSPSAATEVLPPSDPASKDASFHISTVIDDRGNTNHAADETIRPQPTKSLTEIPSKLSLDEEDPSTNDGAECTQPPTISTESRPPLPTDMLQSAPFLVKSDEENLLYTKESDMSKDAFINGKRPSLDFPQNFQSLGDLANGASTILDVHHSAQQDLNSNLESSEITDLNLSAHRPTTLKINSTTNESSSNEDDNSYPNDPMAAAIGENFSENSHLSLSKPSEPANKNLENDPPTQEKPPGSEPDGTLHRPERSPRHNARSTTTLVKVKVEKRATSHSSSHRDRNTNFSNETIHYSTNQPVGIKEKAGEISVEDEVRGLMAEVKEATSQIKQEVKQLRQADTPTPDTPTPLREFKEFLNKEEEQELSRLPTITELGRETEEELVQNIPSAPVSPVVYQKGDIKSFFYQGFINTGTSEQCQSAESSRPTLDSKEKAKSANDIKSESSRKENLESIQSQNENKSKKCKVEAQSQAQTMTHDSLQSHTLVTSSDNLKNDPNERISHMLKDYPQGIDDIRKIVADVTSSMESTLESITAATEGLDIHHGGSSDEGEEQLMLMRDSPRWEDEEIQADDQDEPRAIKAEIKLLVKTTEQGKESIEIRSITEFVDNKEEPKEVCDGQPDKKINQATNETNQCISLKESCSPKFVRSQIKESLVEKKSDDFDLMAEVKGSSEEQKKKKGKKDKKKN